VRVWVDLTNSPHVLVLRPVIAALRARGADVQVTARDFAQTVGLAERFGLGAEVIGRHRGGRLAAKAAGLASRATALAGWAHRSQRRRGRFDLALGHGSNDVTVAAAALRIPRSTMFDYEWATVQHTINCRLAQAVVVPEVIPPQRLDRYGARGKLARYPGLKEEYYLSDFEPDRGVLAQLGVEGAEVLNVVRTAPSYALYLGGSETPLLARVLRRAAADPRVRTVVLARTDQQRAHVRSLGLERVVVPERTVDGRSLVALADVLVSAGGTMNREAAVLGTPVWSMFEGPLGGVDEQLVREGRLLLLSDADAIAFEPKPAGALADRVRRDPGDLLELALPGLS
jgi:predicted glycosyltransferase